jgi:hypothetical protein
VKGSPTFLGQVGAVAGASVSVRQSPCLASGIAIIGGRSYRVGQVASFVRIPQGYHDLFGVVTEVGVNATPEALRGNENRGERWMTVQLVPITTLMGPPIIRIMGPGGDSVTDSDSGTSGGLSLSEAA